MSSSVGLDAILRQLGAFGKYNIVSYSLLLFPMYLAGMYGSVFVFEAPDLSYRCKVPECEHLENTSLWIHNAIPIEDDSLSKCKRYAFKEGLPSNNSFTCDKDNFDHSISSKVECNEYVYSDEDSAVKDFDLGCQNWKRTLIGTIHNTGLFISLPATGIFSDRFGRKKALALASLMNGIFGSLRAFSVNYYMMLILEFLEAALGAGAYSTAFVLAMELVGPKGRVFGNTLCNTFYVMGLMTLAGLSWYYQNWRHVLMTIYPPACLVVSYLWILNESVRWLISKGRTHEAATILKKAAKMNKVELSEDLLEPLYQLEKPKSPSDQNKTAEVAESPSEASVKPVRFMTIMQSSIIRKRVFVCSFLWITCTFIYYGLSINSVTLAGNKYLNFMLISFVEIPANFTALLVLDRIGRKRTLIITYILNACLCISLPLVSEENSWLPLVLFLSGKFAITVSYSTVYVYVSEVFPTNARQSLLATCSSLGRIGSSLAPMTPLLAIYYSNLPAIIFGTMALIATSLVFTLPETNNAALPDTIEDCERLSSKNPKT